MDVYFEKEFLDNFYLDYEDHNPSIGQYALSKIFKEYGEIRSFINIPIDSLEKLQELKKENIFFAYLADRFPPQPVDSIKDHFFHNPDKTQTLIFVNEEKDWLPIAENKGALCFTFNNYHYKIETIISKCHVRTELNDAFPGWNWFSFFADLPFNNLILNDSYILADKSNQRISKNLIPMLKILLNNKERQSISVELFTKDLNPPAPRRPDQVMGEVRKKSQILNSLFAAFKVKFRIIANNLKGRYDFHQRYFFNNFLIVECDKGFNLEPHRGSNSQILAESIFDKYTYRRINNLRKMHQNYLRDLENLETVNFKSYPK